MVVKYNVLINFRGRYYEHCIENLEKFIRRKLNPYNNDEYYNKFLKEYNIEPYDFEKLKEDILKLKSKKNDDLIVVYDDMITSFKSPNILHLLEYLNELKLSPISSVRLGKMINEFKIKISMKELIEANTPKEEIFEYIKRNFLFFNEDKLELIYSSLIQ